MHAAKQKVRVGENPEHGGWAWSAGSDLESEVFVGMFTFHMIKSELSKEESRRALSAALQMLGTDPQPSAVFQGLKEMLSG